MDERGTRDVTEFFNVAKDDALAWPTPVRRTYPDVVKAHMESVYKPFVQKALTVNNSLIGVLNDKLGLPKGTLASFHKVEDHSGCFARVIRAPPHPVPDEKLFLAAHTDYGSLVSRPRWAGFKSLLIDLDPVVPPQPDRGVTSLATRG